jgi:hypothetical protein
MLRAVRIRLHEIANADEFSERPSLEGASARGVGRIAIRDFGDMAKTSNMQVLHQRLKKSHTCFGFCRIGASPNSQPGVNERPHKPWPRSPFVVCAVTVFWTSIVDANVTRIVRRERT